MRLFPELSETIAGTSRAIHEGRRSCLDVLESCLSRIEDWESRIRAWAYLDLERAREEARRLDRELAAGTDRGRLHGIPLGIKDLIDVRGMPTSAGFRPWRERIATEDAPLVAQLRAAGAVILGKTITTQFAWIDPPPTTNPWDLARTPGGSSSGSAAAVATGMCLGAIGSQTGGSIIRPASYCGVQGFKPSHDNVSRANVVPVSPSLDHVGPIARSALDLAILYTAIRREGDSEHARQFPLHAGNGGIPVTDSGGWRAEDLASLNGPPTLGRLRGVFEERAEPEMRHAFDQAVESLCSVGAQVVEIELPHLFSDVHRCHRVIMASEAAVEHQERLANHREEYQPKIRALVEEGLSISAPEYIRSLTHKAELTAAIERLFGHSVQALIMPATLGVAPDRSSTGDPIFNSPWSYTGAPALSVPIALSSAKLPLALQLVGKDAESEKSLFEVGLWCEHVLRTAQANAESVP